MSEARGCRLAFYGDDFTGSTDALEVLSFAGLRCLLFLKPPEPAVLARFPGLDAVGIAGDSRAMSPAEMDATMPGVFAAMAGIGAPIVHYKVCSTFDSSATVGSIGRIMEIARKTFAAGLIPVVAGTPALGRYCLFGNLFARSGTDGRVYRIDRHPIMSVHPVTPMTEGDLAIHLAAQGDVAIEKFPYPWLEAGREAARGHLRELADSGAGAVLFDAALPAHLTDIGYLLVEQAKRRRPVFVVGGSGVESALTQVWREHEGLQDTHGKYDDIRPVDRLLVVSGSASRLTAAQIEAAVQRGFVDIPVAARDLLDEPGWHRYVDELARRTAGLLNGNRSVVLHTARGPDDPRIGDMLDAVVLRGCSRAEAMSIGGRELGVRLGELTRRILELAPLPRIVVAGGDTSSQVIQALGPEALEVMARLAPGAPLCRTISHPGHRGGLEVALKGGQMGAVGFFETARTGAASLQS